MSGAELATCEGESLAPATRPTLSVKLDRRKAQLEKELDQVNATIDLLKKHPEVQQVFDAVSELNLRW